MCVGTTSDVLGGGLIAARRPLRHLCCSPRQQFADRRCSTLSHYASLGNLSVFWVQFASNPVATMALGDKARRPGAEKRIKHRPADRAAGQDARLNQIGGDMSRSERLYMVTEIPTKPNACDEYRAQRFHDRQDAFLLPRGQSPVNHETPCLILALHRHI